MNCAYDIRMPSLPSSDTTIEQSDLLPFCLILTQCMD